MLTATCAFGARAAEPRVTSQIQPDSIFIGDRFELIIDVEKDQVQSVVFPELSFDEAAGFELVEESPVDTLAREGRRQTLRKHYVLAAFEEGRFNMGRAAVFYFDKNIADTLYSDNENTLFVNTFIIDSTSRGIYDFKPQKDMPFRFGEISGYVGMAVAGLVVLALLVWLLVRYFKKRGRGLRSIFRPAPPLPPHVVAIRALEELHNRKLWQNNRHKAYYSGLSEILRTYIGARYGIGAMEMTTDEIIEAVLGVGMPPKCMADLECVLRDADLAKFAKFRPEAEQNEADYNKAYYFVEETKEAEPRSGDEDEILEKQLKGGR